MPFVKVTSNVAAADVNQNAVLKQLSLALSTALGRPEPYCMAQLKVGAALMFQGNTEVRGEEF